MTGSRSFDNLEKFSVEVMLRDPAILEKLTLEICG